MSALPVITRLLPELRRARPLDALGRAWRLASGAICTECHWWAPIHTWSNVLDCPNCGQEVDPVVEARWVRDDA